MLKSLFKLFIEYPMKMVWGIIGICIVIVVIEYGLKAAVFGFIIVKGYQLIKKYVPIAVNAIKAKIENKEVK